MISLDKPCDSQIQESELIQQYIEMKINELYRNDIQHSTGRAMGILHVFTRETGKTCSLFFRIAGNSSRKLSVSIV